VDTTGLLIDFKTIRKKDPTRLIFGAAALGAMRQEKADQILSLLLERGINHIDAAASYGDAELRIAPWMAQHRERFFLATKTGKRDHAGAWRHIERSLQRLQTDRIDLIQLHNLSDEPGWQMAFSEDGALRALCEAREQGLVRFIGVTGHGTAVASLHLRSLARFPFDSVLVPYNPAMMSQPRYAGDFEALYAECQRRGVAMQTIKAVAARRWRPGEARTHNTWYQPLSDQGDIACAVHWALARPGIFVNSASDLGILELTLDAAERFESPPPEREIRETWSRIGVEPLFVPGLDGVG
jgi:aryl-alcohol dehydrogenase-like predicted oxidoreductase